MKRFIGAGIFVSFLVAAWISPANADNWLDGMEGSGVERQVADAGPAENTATAANLAPVDIDAMRNSVESSVDRTFDNNIQRIDDMRIPPIAVLSNAAGDGDGDDLDL